MNAIGRTLGRERVESVSFLVSPTCPSALSQDAQSRIATEAPPAWQKALAATGALRAGPVREPAWVADAIVPTQGVSYQDNSLMEFNAQLGYESKLGFGIEAGWRSVRIEVAEFDDVDSAKIDISGPYAALNYHF